jgi:hypothetical protein
VLSNCLTDGLHLGICRKFIKGRKKIRVSIRYVKVQVSLKNVHYTQLDKMRGLLDGLVAAVAVVLTVGMVTRVKFPTLIIC